MIIALAGKKHSGKDTFARSMGEGWVRVAFADVLKDIAQSINPRFDGKPLDELVRDLGWDGAKEVRGVRTFLQDLGESVRKADPDYWVRPVDELITSLRTSGHHNIVVTDVRHANEAREMRRMGGLVLQIDRPELAEVDKHISEQLEGILPDMTITNTGWGALTAVAANLGKAWAE